MGTCILVLGTHRGGTSCTAGVLHRLGVDMNPTSGSLPGNTHEDLELELLHEEAIGHWTTPVVDFDRVKTRYKKALRQREHKELWGYKDPRLNFLLPWVMPLLHCEVRIVSVRRPPSLVAKGVVRANPGMSLDEATRITKAYQEAQKNALRYAAGKAQIFPVLYDQLVDHRKTGVGGLANFIGLPVVQEAVTFIDPELRHYK